MKRITREGIHDLKGMSISHLGVGGCHNEGGSCRSWPNNLCYLFGGMHWKDFPLSIRNAGQRSALSTPWNRVKRTGAAWPFAGVDWEASSDVCECISSESSCISRAVGAEVSSTRRASSGIRVVGLWQGSTGYTEEVLLSIYRRSVTTSWLYSCRLLQEAGQIGISFVFASLLR